MYREYEVFEVYNPSYRRGGKLNITRKYTWQSSVGPQPPSKQTRHERRKNFGGLTFTGVLTVLIFFFD